MLKSQKGSVILIFMVFFILMFTLFSVYMNIRSSYEIFNRFESAVIETANYRAQAVDTYLKESFNIIESFHKPHSSSDPNPYSNNHAQDIKHEELVKDLPYGHTKIALPSDANYQAAYLNANSSAQNLFVKLMTKYLDAGKTTFNSDGNNYKLQPENLCIDVKPLPTKGSALSPNNATIEFSCEVTLNGEKIKIKEKVKVATVSDPKLTKLVYNPNGVLGDEDDVYSKVVNVVFVAAVIQHDNLLTNLYNYMEKTFDPDFDAEKRNVSKKYTYAIAYPQNDRCYGTHCADY